VYARQCGSEDIHIFLFYVFLRQILINYNYFLSATSLQHLHDYDSLLRLQHNVTVHHWWYMVYDVTSIVYSLTDEIMACSAWLFILLQHSAKSGGKCHHTKGRNTNVVL